MRVEGNLVVRLPARIGGIYDLADLGALQPVIVAGPPDDDRLWAGLRSLGGYDLLMKPLEAEETCGRWPRPCAARSTLARPGASSRRLGSGFKEDSSGLHIPETSMAHLGTGTGWCPMLIIGLLFLLGSVLALRVKPPADRPNDSYLYRIDNRVVAAVCFLIGLCFLVLSLTLKGAVAQ